MLYLRLYEKVWVMGFFYLIAIFALIPSVYAFPRFKSFDFSGDLDELMVTWDVEFDDLTTTDEITVDCELIKRPGISQTCSPSYKGIGVGSCSFGPTIPPDYNMTQDGNELKTYGNTLRCEACNESEPTECDVINEVFYPIYFETISPTELASVVGESTILGVKVTNFGILEDRYIVELFQLDDKVAIHEHSKNSSYLRNGDLESIFMSYRLLSSEQISSANLRITSDLSMNPTRNWDNITYEKTVSFKGSEKSLPGLDYFGIIQILILAAISINFLI